MALCRAAKILEELKCDKIILHPLYIKLRLIQQFVKALDKNGNCFKYTCSVFLDLMIEKFKAEIFYGPQIHKLLKDTNFMKTVSENEHQLGKPLQWCNISLGNTKVKTIQTLLPTWYQLLVLLT